MKENIYKPTDMYTYIHTYICTYLDTVFITGVNESVFVMTELTFILLYKIIETDGKMIMVAKKLIVTLSVII